MHTSTTKSPCVQVKGMTMLGMSLGVVTVVVRPYHHRRKRDRDVEPREIGFRRTRDDVREFAHRVRDVGVDLGDVQSYEGRDGRESGLRREADDDSTLRPPPESPMMPDTSWARDGSAFTNGADGVGFVFTIVWKVENRRLQERIDQFGPASTVSRWVKVRPKHCTTGEIAGVKKESRNASDTALQRTAYHGTDLLDVPSTGPS